jgi:sulfatase maturation enzyme AslB (radical SAM superfamily)
MTSTAVHPTYLSVTTIIGCPVQCLKYCPQELITKTYKGKRAMTLSDYKAFIEHVPASTPIYMGGFSEPLVNQETIAMLEWTAEKGHDIRMFTTGIGLKPEDVKRFCRIPYDILVLHEPDAEGIAHIPGTKDYLENMHYIKTHVKRWRSMHMGPPDFDTNHREDVARGTWNQPRYRTKRSCLFMEAPRYELMPNGEMYFCCECSCLSMRIGSLHETPYNKLVEQHQYFVRRFRNDPESICQNCCQSFPLWQRNAERAILKTKYALTGGRMIKELPVIRRLWI